MCRHGIGVLISKASDKRGVISVLTLTPAKKKGRHSRSWSCKELIVLKKRMIHWRGMFLLRQTHQWETYYCHQEDTSRLSHVLWHCNSLHGSRTVQGLGDKWETHSEAALLLLCLDPLQLMALSNLIPEKRSCSSAGELPSSHAITIPLMKAVFSPSYLESMPKIIEIQHPRNTFLLRHIPNYFWSTYTYIVRSTY